MLLFAAMNLDSSNSIAMNRSNQSTTIINTSFGICVGCVLLGMPGLLVAGNVQPPIVEIRQYTDQDYEFSMAVPAGWQRIITVESENEIGTLESGYAVGFESPKSSSHDKFADYIMVEILPGSSTGGFQTSGKNKQQILINGQIGTSDLLNLHNFQFQNDKLNLIVYQAELFELGYTIGFYAIGEQREAGLMQDAFKLMIDTFSLPTDPFNLI